MKLAAALAGSILSLTTLVAHGAAPTGDAYSITVQFADLDLDRDAGVATLYVRIRGAARRVCEPQLNDPLAMPTYGDCVKRAVTAAVARIDTPRLSDYVAQRGAKPVRPAPASLAAR